MLEIPNHTAEFERKTEVALVTSREFLDSLTNEAIKHPDTETGGYILGLRDTSSPCRIRLITINSFTPTDQSEIRRSGGSLVLGGENSNYYRKWQLAHWPDIYKTFCQGFSYDPKNPSTKLTILGIWHKHPGSYMDHSSIDDSAVDSILSGLKEDFLFPIIVLREKSLLNKFTHLKEGACYIGENKNYFIEAVFYYRNSKNNRVDAVMPNIIGSEFFPRLAPNPWFTEDPELFKKEKTAFESIGFATNLQFITSVGGMETRIWLVLEHKNLPFPLYIRTSQDFHQDKTFFLKFSNPAETRGSGMGMILPNSEDVRMADIIKPVFLFLVKKYERTR